jgi:hypothetical protein
LAVSHAFITKEVPFTIVPTESIPNAAAPVAPTVILVKNMIELEVTAVVETVAVPATRVTVPNELAPAVVVEATFALRSLFPEVTKLTFPVILIFPDPAFRFSADVVLVVPIVIAFAAAPVPIFIVLTPVEYLQT